MRGTNRALTVGAAAAAMAAGNYTYLLTAPEPDGTVSNDYRPGRPAYKGIPLFRNINQRQRRKRHRQTRPHGW